MRQIDPTARVSPHARIYAERLVVGKNCRIDDGAILTGDIEIGDYVHIGAYAVLTGRGGIRIGSYTGISMFAVLLTGSDDFSGRSMLGPCVPDKYKPFLSVGKIVVGSNTIVGAHSTVMPGVSIGDGVSVGAYSLVNRDLAPDGIYAGAPAKLLKARSRESWDLVRQLEADERL